MSRTILISEIFPPIHGGSGRWFYELYSRLSPDAIIIAAGTAPKASEFDPGQNLRIYRLDLSSPSWGIKSLRGIRFYLRTLNSVKTILDREKVNFIHCGRCIPEGLVGCLLKWLYGIPYICYVHGEELEFSSLSRELSLLVRMTTRNANLLICNSENTRGLLITAFKPDRQKTAVLHPGVDAHKFIPAPYDIGVRRELGWHHRPVILTVGRLQQRKGHDMLIKALPQIIQAHADVLYAIVGDGEERESLEKLVGAHQLEAHVMFMSEIEDTKMIQCYQQCTLFVLPNRAVNKDIEGFGMVLVEAQSCGKPVIAGDSGGTAETMRVGESGYVIDCTKPEPLAAAIIGILNNPGLVKEMGNAARAHIVNHLDWKAHASKASQLFESAKM
ncbi:GDP-mannose-dependent alpha-(1-6)-phosphatidylinositol monomannoside mannosyltransferase [Thiorhodovibrio winogradskyi]|uniref:GDP-mannose-dependent alpha-(1-6)-phosphatidylinositol monomannoside mannosyltransferase n=1 Tax=Thiorhodovibrio winogradskyi TaxID=77007 RepID=A0ABZ0SC51_9GAMM|nr:glycosyltransferase family 4 protein [Thiorhodovibrio winogradskyi]